METMPGRPQKKKRKTLYNESGNTDSESDTTFDESDNTFDESDNTDDESGNIDDESDKTDDESDNDNNERVAAEIREVGGEATAYQCDVTKLDDIKQISEDIRCNIGDVDILVNNAGVLNGGPLLQLSDKDIRRTMDVNIMAHFWTCREFLPAMMKRNEGHIINVASMAGKMGVAYLVDYSASKFAVIGMTESIAIEMERLGKDGIHLTVVCPLFVDTGLARHPRDRFGRIFSPAEVATAVIEGAAMNKSCVYMPAGIETQLRFQLMFPKKFIRWMREFLDLGINPQYGEKQE